MSFLDELRGFLDDVAKAPDGLANGPAVTIDEAACRRYLIEALERLEQMPGVSTEQITSLHKVWTQWDRVARFARNLATALRGGLAYDASAEALQRMVHIGIARQLGLPETAGGVARTLELDRLAAAASDGPPFFTTAPVSSQIASARAYAYDVRAVRGVDRSRLSPVGKVFLEMSGKDAVRWLLHVEVELAIGRWDDRRLSREAAQAILAEPERTWHEQDPDDGPPCPYAVLRRLSKMNLVALHDDPYDPAVTGFTLLSSGQELLTELVGRQTTPFQVLAEALVKDETHQVLKGVQAPTLALALQTSSAESVALQARLVAHEMTNALGPARVALEQLTAALTSARGSAERLGPLCERIEAGFKRAFDFLDELKATATLADARDSFQVEEALRQAMDEAESPLPVDLQVVQPLPPLRGYRDRFVLAMRDLLRNAQHAVPSEGGQIHVSARLDGAYVQLQIDDNGPGVPAEYRQAVFADGFTLRPGGSGQGLALLKQVVEQEMRGSVQCEDSHLGGARFHVRLPLFPGEQS